MEEGLLTFTSNKCLYSIHVNIRPCRQKVAIRYVSIDHDSERRFGKGFVLLCIVNDVSFRLTTSACIF